jgi:hypothetical protein
MRGAPLIAVVAVACGGGDGGGSPDGGERVLPPPTEDLTRDIARTDLSVDVSTMEATAVIAIEAGEAGGATFEIGDLEILAVADEIGPLEHADRGTTLDVGVPAGSRELHIEYRYAGHSSFDGSLPNGLTFLWPYFCGNLFPCKSDPADGTELALELTGIAANDTAVFAPSVDAEAPSYMLAWAIGAYSYTSLGVTAAGTEIGYYALPGDDATLAAGTANLAGAFEWLEQSLGSYLYGDRVASVSAPWGPGAFGGMEHHPLWHVSTGSLGDQETHAHEAAHGWFGNGVRIACWEDFVLSEGTVSYLAARALEDVAGTGVSDPIWDGYRAQLDANIAWPQGCNQIDIIEDGLFTSAPYVKGALFFRSLEARIGRAEIDAALAAFYVDRAGTAARFDDWLDHVEAETGYDARPCAASWLRQPAIPATEVCP